MKPMHRGVPQSSYATYIIRVRPLGPAEDPTTRHIFIVEILSDNPERIQFESMEALTAFLTEELYSVPFDEQESDSIRETNVTQDLTALLEERTMSTQEGGCLLS